MSDAQVPSTPQQQEAEREARIADLAAGFALGELQDSELGELYEALREPGDRGVRAARLAWQQLAMVTDLRANLGAAFQETVRHRIAKEGLSDRFVKNARSRLGMPGHGLPELSAPRPTPRVRRGALLLALLVLLSAALARALIARPRPLCEVRAVVGGATLGGETLLPHSPIDGRQVVVPAGSELMLGWGTLAEVVISGPANAIAQPAGISISNGQAWISANGAFTIGLPDGTIHAGAAGKTDLAVEVADGHSVLGSSAGSLATAVGRLTTGEALSGADTFPWTSASLDQLPERTVAVPVWSMEAHAAWKQASDAVQLTVSGENRLQGWSILWRPGAVQLLALGDATPRILTLKGPPLSDMPLAISVRGGHLHLSCGTDEIADEPLPGRSALELSVSARAALAGLSWRSGPPQHPPLALADPSASAR